VSAPAREAAAANGASRRRRRRLLLGALIAAPLLAGGVLAAGAGEDAEPPVPLHTVREEPFRRRVVAEGVLEAADAMPITVPTEVFGAVRIAWMVPEGAPVAAGDVVVRLDPTELERELTGARDDRASADLKLDKAEAQAGSAASNLGRDAALAGEELEFARTFQKRDEEVFSRQEIIESEVDEQLAARRREHAESERGIRERLARTEQALLEVERRKADLAIDRASTGLRLLEVVAPHAGFVTRHRDWMGNKVREGDTVWRGQKLGEMPNLSRLQAEVWVLEADAGGIAPGKRATVTVEARPDARIAGEVTRVEGVAQPRIPGSPVQYFGVTLTFEGALPAALKPGQRVRAEIELENRPRALVVPRQALFDVDGESVVYRFAGGELAAVPVKVEAVGAGRIVIAEGIAAGDRIALSDPTAAAAPEPAESGGRGPVLPGAR
jgi:RND family efflux transporter MFP subunit